MIRGASERGIAIVCGGIGNLGSESWAALLHDPAFAARLDSIDERLTRHGMSPIRDEMEVLRTGWSELRFAFPFQYSVQVGLCEVLRSWGAPIEAYVGCSSGEFAAARMVGAISDSDAALLCREFAGAIGTEASRCAEVHAEGGLAIVCSEEVEFRSRAGAEVFVAGRLGGGYLMLAGARSELADLVSALSRDGTFARTIDIHAALHCPRASTMATELSSSLSSVQPGAAGPSLYSALEGGLTDRPRDASYWAEMLREPVCFSDAVREMFDDGYSTFVEVGARPSLARPIGSEALRRGVSVTSLAMLASGVAPSLSLRAAADALVRAGVELDDAAVARTIAKVVSGRASTTAVPRLPTPVDGSKSMQADSSSEAPSRGVASAPLRGEIRSLVREHGGYTTDDADDFNIDSLGAFELAAGIEQRFGVRLSHGQVLRAGTIPHLAAVILSARRSSAAVPSARSGRWGLTLSQQALWIASDGGANGLYHVRFVFEVPPDVVFDRLRRAIKHIVDWSPGLRTTFSVGPTGDVQATAHEDLAPVIRHIHADGELSAALGRFIEVPFDLARQSALRWVFVTRREQPPVVALVWHHLGCDLWSIATLLGRLGEAYCALGSRSDWAPRWPAAPTQAELLGREAHVLHADGETLARFWSQELADPPRPVSLADRPRGVGQWQKAARTVVVDHEITRWVDDEVARLGGTRFHAWLSIFAAWLCRVTGRPEVLVAAPTAGRDSTLSDLLGYCVNPVILRLRAASDGAVHDAMRAASRRVRRAIARSDLPYPLQLAHLPSDTTGEARGPRFAATWEDAEAFGGGRGTRVDLDDSGREIWGVGSMTWRPLPYVVQDDQFELTLRLRPVGGRLHATFEYQRAAFSQGRLDALLADWQAFTRSWTIDPCSSSPAPPSMLEDSSDSEALDPSLSPERPPGAGGATVSAAGALEASVHSPRAPGEDGADPVDPLFLERWVAQVRVTPDAVAVRELSEPRKALTYAELDAWSNGIGHVLRTRGVGPEVLVGIFGQRRSTSVAALLGILKAGGAWVPIEPRHPARRIGQIIEQTGLGLVLATGESAQAACAVHGVECLDPADIEPTRAATTESGARAQSAAYVLFTSGTTGRPKGVVVTRSALAFTTNRLVEAFSLGPECRFLQYSSWCFDVSISDIMPALASGGSVCMIDEDQLLPGPGLHRLLSSGAFTHAILVPSVLAAMPVVDGRSLPVLITGGEVCSAGLAQKWAVGRRLFNAYGPAEATVICSAIELARFDRQPPIGWPLRGVRFHVLDDTMHPVAIGAVGQLFIESPGLARGYLGDEQTTRQAFRMIALESGRLRRVYASGDRVRIVDVGDDGSPLVEFIGRVDHQVKRRGHRIEFGDIEAALATHHRVVQALVESRRQPGGEFVLVAHAVVDPAPEPAGGLEDELRQHVSEQLPRAMLPDALCLHSAWPTTLNGKVDRQALARADIDRPAQRERTGPLTPAQRWTAALWGEVFGADVRDPRTSFFDIGGNSLHVVRLSWMMLEREGVEVPPSELLRSPTLAEHAALVDRVRAAAAGTFESSPAEDPKRPEGNESIHRGRTIARRARSTTTSAAERDVGRASSPLSRNQLALWHLFRLAPDGVSYNASWSVWLDETPDPTRLADALRAVLTRHPILTAWVVRDGSTVRQNLDSSRRSEIEVHVCRTEDDVLARAQELVWQPFDLEAGHLLRLHVIKSESSPRAVLLLVGHHFILDGVSLFVVVDDLMAGYSARLPGSTPPRPATGATYLDFVSWQLRYLESAEAQRSRRLWAERFAAQPERRIIDDTRWLGSRPCDTAAIDFDVGRSTLDAIDTASRRVAGSRAAFVAGAFHIALARLAGGGVALGLVTAGRPTQAFESTVGDFVNLVPVVLDEFSAMSCDEYAAHAAERVFEALDHQHLPYLDLVQALGPRPDARGGGPVRYSLVYQRFDRRRELLDLMVREPSYRARLGGLSAAPCPLRSQEGQFDITLEVFDMGDALRCRLKYDRQQFHDATIERLGAAIVGLLLDVSTGGPAPVSRALRQSPAEAGQIEIWNRSSPMFEPRESVPETISRVASKCPDAVAIIGEGTTTYGQLEELVCAARTEMIVHGVERGDRVAVHLARGVDAIVAMLAIMQIGAVYVPVDAELPPGRVEDIIDDCSPKLIWRGQGPAVEGRHPTGRENSPPLSLESAADLLEYEPDAPAYIVYTSGSTGRPKGAINSHGAIAHHVRFNQAIARLRPGQRVLHKTPLSFDVAVGEVLWPLSAGATLVVVEPGGHRDPRVIARNVSDHGVAVAIFVPSQLRGFLATVHAAVLAELELAFCLGEELTPDLVDGFTTHSPARLINVYGPAEAAVAVTWWDVKRRRAGSGSIPIGRPYDGTMVRIVNSALEPVPLGVEGEILLVGAQVGLGYHARPEASARAFVDDPLPTGLRAYRTGDRGRWLPDGTLEFRGRQDHQLKIRGNRIELGEIEVHVLRIPSVRHAVVVPQLESGRPVGLIAYVVMADDALHETASIRDALCDRLPEYMIPSRVVELSHLPLNSSGKVDRKALPDPSALDVPLCSGRSPTTPDEVAIAAIWGDVLDLPTVPVDIGFFALGGHSLLLATIQNRLREERGVDVSMASLLAHPTIATLARFVSGAGALPARAVPRAADAQAAITSIADRMAAARTRKGPDE